MDSQISDNVQMHRPHYTTGIYTNRFIPKFFIVSVVLTYRGPVESTLVKVNGGDGGA